MEILKPTVTTVYSERLSELIDFAIRDVVNTFFSEDKILLNFNEELDSLITSFDEQTSALINKYKVNYG